ncbi:putative reverse transcriptase, RNA-dependent DNA polymerase [Tanacetum coccineum]
MKDEECESVDSTKYRGMIGSLLYLRASRPDIMFSVCLCARFQEDPKTSHLEAVKRIFRYIKGTTHLGLWYPKGTGIETVVYADSDHAGDYVDRKSTSGICTFVGCCLTSWFSKKQTALAISTTEAEYVSARKACQQALWMKQALIDYDIRLDDVPIMCDNKGAIDLSKNPVQHSRTKHIEIRHHFLRDNVQKGHISIEKVPSVDNIADILTKPLKLKLCLEHEVKRGNKVVKKELIVALRGEFYFVKFIINLEEDDVEHGVILGRSFLRMTKAITDFRAGTVTIYPEIDPFLEDIEEKEKNGKIVKEEEEAVKRIKGEALKKDDPGAFIFPIRLEGQVNENALADTGSDINTMPYRIYKQLGREEMKKVDRRIAMINHTQAEAMGILTNVLCQVGVTTLIAKFLILDIPIDRDAPIVVGWGFLHTIGGIVNTPERLFSTFDGFCHQTFRGARSDVMRNAESDSDDEEEYQIKRNKFGASIYGPKPAPYLNFSFLGLLPVPLKYVNWKPDYKGSYTKEEEAIGQWRTKIMLTDPYENIYLQGFTTEKTDQKLSKYHKLWEHTMMRPDHQDPNALDKMNSWKIYCYHKFTMSSCYGKDVPKMQSLELYHEFYSTCEFDEVCANDELQTKKIIKFRLGRRAHCLTLLEFAQRLGLYQAVELDEEGFNVYFEGGLRSDEHFNTHEYWYANVAWLIARWMKRKRAGTQKESQICCGQFISKIAKKCKVLIEDVVRSLSASIYCRDLDTITLRDLIDSEGKLIPEDPQPGVPRVGILDLREHLCMTYTIGWVGWRYAKKL